MRFSLTAALLASAASLAAALTTPVGDPSGNPISKPGLGEIVPVGKPYAITWNPTTTGTVSIVLLRGPSTNVVPIATLVEGVENSGTYMWMPDTSLEADTLRYGLQLIVDATGQYQYSTQFGISNPSGPTSHSAKVTAVAANSTYNSTSEVHTKTTVHVASTGYPAVNTTVVKPTGHLTVPTTLLTEPTEAAAPAATSTTAGNKSAAGQVVASLSSLFLAVAAVFSLAL